MHTGIGSLINVGTTIGAGTATMPGALARGKIKKGERLIKRSFFRPDVTA